jgi:acetylornithine deacetylase/succinyl-diaminopimelate desuccinylase-like protein
VLRQYPDRVAEAFPAWVQKKAPAGIAIERRALSAPPGLVVNPNHPAIQVAAKALAGIFRQPTVFTRSGGSILIVGEMGFGLRDDGRRSPNEKYNIENY